MLNKQRGNMYNFCTHTWNAIKGKCPYDCEYCYMKVFPQGELRFDEKELKTDLGRNNFIFVGSSCDMFAETIPKEWILKVLDYCNKFPENTYLFQTKNPKRYFEFINEFPPNCLFGTTIETNRQEELDKISKAPKVTERQYWIGEINFGKVFLTLEPIMDFDLEVLVNWLKDIDPHFVNIGADSKGHNLPEPSKEKILKLVEELNKFTEIKKKENLGRLLK